MKKDQTQATAYVILETRWPNSKGIYKLKLKVTHKRVPKYYSIVIPEVPASLTEEEFNKIKSERPRSPYSDYRDRINQVESRAKNVIIRMGEFTFDKFERNFFEPDNKEKDFLNAIESYIKELKKQERIGTASSYNCTLNSLTRFCEVKKYNYLTVDEITVEFMNSWEKWMLSEGNSLTTVGIYARNIRAILNKAKVNGLMNEENYPFGKGRYEIPAGSNIKKALDLSEIKKLFYYEAQKGSPEEKARDLWIFSYLCNGINMKDIARLKFKNIDFDSIVFVRAKTERKQRSNQKTILVPLTTEIEEIINRSGNNKQSNEQFVFPILCEGLSPERERAIIQQATKITNKYIKRIAAELGIKNKVTTYTARHSFATILKRSGASIEFISESLGHSNIKTTESYLASFEMVTKRKFAENLTKFKINKK